MVSAPTEAAVITTAETASIHEMTNRRMETLLAFIRPAGGVIGASQSSNRDVVKQSGQGAAPSERLGIIWRARQALMSSGSMPVNQLGACAF